MYKTPATTCRRQRCSYNCSIRKSTFGLAAVCFLKQRVFFLQKLSGADHSHLFTQPLKNTVLLSLHLFFKSCLNCPNHSMLLDCWGSDNSGGKIQQQTYFHLSGSSCTSTQFMIEVVSSTPLQQLGRKHTQNLLRILGWYLTWIRRLSTWEDLCSKKQLLYSNKNRT